jgi:hypothetical protein
MMEPPKNTPQLPIGYWLKRADEAITIRVNQIHAAYGFTRFRWQVLNSIYEADTISKHDLFATMRTFITAQELDALLDGFAQAGWLLQEGAGESAMLGLTATGKMERETLITRQNAVRRQAVQGITEQEYVLVIEALQRIVANLQEEQASTGDRDDTSA